MVKTERKKEIKKGKATWTGAC